MLKSQPSFQLSKFLQKVIVFLFLFLLLTTPLVFTWANEELFEFNKMLLTYGVTIFILGAWLARMVVEEKILFRRTPFDIPIAFFVGSQVLSTIFSMHPHTSIFGYYTRSHGGLLSTFAYVTLFYAFVNTIERKHLSLIFFTTFLSAGIVSLLAIPEHFGHAFTCLLINTSQKMVTLGGQAWLPDNLAASFNASCWVQDVQSRVFATFGQPNWLAAYAITLLPLGLTLSNLTNFSKTQSGGKLFTGRQLFYAVVTLCLFVTLLFTKSRSGFIGLVLGLVGYAAGFLLVNLKNEKFFSTTTSKLAGLFAIILVLALSFGTPYTPSLQQLIARQKTVDTVKAAPATQNRLEEGGTDSGEIRKIVWQGALKVWQRYPIFGSGVETFAYSYYLDRPVEHNLVSEWDFLYNKAHNEFLNFLATTGTVGFLAYVAMLAAFVVIPAVRSLEFLGKEKKLDHSLFALAVISGIISVSVSNFFGFSTVMVSILLFLLPAMYLVFVQDDKENAPLNALHASVTYSTGQVIQLLAISLGTLLFAAGVVNLWLADWIYTTGRHEQSANNASDALKNMERAKSLNPGEGIFYDELSNLYGRYALAYAQAGEATAAAQFAQTALKTSDELLELNPVHLNYYKSRLRLLLTLSQLNPQALIQAREVLTHARTLAPTDPKLAYNLGLVEISSEQQEQGIAHLEEAVKLKPNYAAARLSLATQYEALEKYEAAKEQYAYILQNISPDDEQTNLKLQSVEASISASKGVKKK